MRELVIPAELYDELARTVLGKGGCLRFTARGFSMHPFLRDGDTVVVQPVDASQLEPGSVALYRTSLRKLVAHRVIGVNPAPDSAESVIIVRGETVSSTRETVREENLLGQVVSVERGGRVIGLDRGWGRLVQRLSVTCRPLAMGLAAPREMARRTASRVLRAIQNLGPYRRVAKITIAIPLCYGMTENEAEPEWFFWHRVIQPALLDRAGIQPEFDSGQAQAFQVTAMLGAREMGSLALRRFHDNTECYPDWWLFSLRVHPLLRGAGVGERLTRMALTKASELGAARVNVLVQETARPALKLYEKMGFGPRSIPPLEVETARQALAGGPKLRILSKSLTQMERGKSTDSSEPASSCDRAGSAARR